MDSKDREPPTLLIDELFARQDGQFIEKLREVRSAQYLAALADRWKRDPRPWAREQLIAYLSLPLDRPGHHPLVKRLFKHAEAQRDDELMAYFLVAFDRLVRRRRRMTYRYDWQTRTSWREETLYSPQDQILPKQPPRVVDNPSTGRKITLPAYERAPKNGRLYTYRTRHYLRRRVWRYFRWLGFGTPGDYPRAVAKALLLYRDDDFAQGENILDNWSLLNIAFRGSEALKFKTNGVSVADGRSLGELTAAPRFEELWQAAESTSVLLHLAQQTDARLVRVWAIQLLKRHHLGNLQSLSTDQLLELLDHHDGDVQQFGASLLDALSGVDLWTVSTWLRLLETRNLTALAVICEAMTRRVRSDRLSTEQCVELACARVTPIAKMGLSWLRERTIAASELPMLGRLAGAQCEALGAEIASYALERIGAQSLYQTDVVVNFFDSLNPEVRRGAWQWLTPDSPGYQDADLWSRLFESPYDETRLRLVDSLQQRADGLAGPRALARRDLSPLWASVLLGVHRGGRAKIQALRQISQTVAERPERAESLLPVLAVAIRSVRPAEARVGLSAILTAVAKRPEIEPLLAKGLPELRLKTAGGAT